MGTSKRDGHSLGDYDCDGWFDIFKTNFADDTCNLYHNNATAPLPMRRLSPEWHHQPVRRVGCGFLDYDNDGWRTSCSQWTCLSGN